MKFSPTETQIAAAQQLFIAMAFRDITRQEFEKFETEILQTGNYHYDHVYNSEKWQKRGFVIPNDAIIRDRTDLHCIRGLSLLGTPDYENSDCQIFYAELAKKATAAGFIHTENAAAVADNDVIRLEAELIEATYNIHHIALDKIVMLDHRKQLVEYLLHLFSPLVKNESYEDQQRKFYNERMTEKVKLKNETYSNDEASFKKFQALKKFIPIEEFVTTVLERPDEKEFYKGVEGVHIYKPFAYLFQIKESQTWEYDYFKFASCRFVAIYDNGEIFENDSLETVERELFKDFLKDYLK